MTSCLCNVRIFRFSAIGDRTQLPRGRLIGGNAPNPYFWRSVHASGDEGIKLQERIKQEEKDLWRSKVVVDSLDFKVIKAPNDFIRLFVAAQSEQMFSSSRSEIF